VYGLQGTVVMCMDKIYSSTCQKREGRQGTECGWPTGSNRCRQATRAVRGKRGTPPRVWCGKCPPALPPFFYPSLRFVLFFLHFWLSRAPFFSLSLFFFFLFTSEWHSLILRAGSNRLLFVSRWQSSIPTVLCSLAPPSNKAPSQHRHTD
jgi:hypothetical protein